MISNKGQDKHKCAQNKKRVVVIVLAIVLVVIFAGWAVAFLILNPDYQYHPRGDRFYVRVDSPPMNYQIMLPIPVENNLNPWYLLESLNVTLGNATFALVNTTKGSMLSIDGNGSITLESKVAPRGTTYYAVMPQNYTLQIRREGIIPYFIFLNASGETTEMKVSYDAVSWEAGYTDLCTEIDISGGLIEGWLEVYGEAYQIRI